MVKKILIILLIIPFAFTVASCGDDNSNGNGNGDDNGSTGNGSDNGNGNGGTDSEPTAAQIIKKAFTSEAFDNVRQETLSIFQTIESFNLFTEEQEELQDLAGLPFFNSGMGFKDHVIIQDSDGNKIQDESGSHKFGNNGVIYESFNSKWSDNERYFFLHNDAWYIAERGATYPFDGFTKQAIDDNRYFENLYAADSIYSGILKIFFDAFSGNNIGLFDIEVITEGFTEGEGLIEATLQPANPGSADRLEYFLYALLEEERDDFEDIKLGFSLNAIINEDASVCFNFDTFWFNVPIAIDDSEETYSWILDVQILHNVKIDVDWMKDYEFNDLDDLVDIQFNQVHTLLKDNVLAINNIMFNNIFR